MEMVWWTCAGLNNCSWPAGRCIATSYLSLPAMECDCFGSAVGSDCSIPLVDVALNSFSTFRTLWLMVCVLIVVWSASSTYSIVDRKRRILSRQLSGCDKAKRWISDAQLMVVLACGLSMALLTVACLDPFGNESTLSSRAAGVLLNLPWLILFFAFVRILYVFLAMDTRYVGRKRAVALVLTCVCLEFAFLFVVGALLLPLPVGQWIMAALAALAFGLLLVPGISMRMLRLLTPLPMVRTNTRERHARWNIRFLLRVLSVIAVCLVGVLLWIAAQPARSAKVLLSQNGTLCLLQCGVATLLMLLMGHSPPRSHTSMLSLPSAILLGRSPRSSPIQHVVRARDRRIHPDSPHQPVQLPMRSNRTAQPPDSGPLVSEPPHRPTGISPTFAWSARAQARFSLQQDAQLPFPQEASPSNRILSFSHS